MHGEEGRDQNGCLALAHAQVILDVSEPLQSEQGGVGMATVMLAGWGRKLAANEESSSELHVYLAGAGTGEGAQLVTGRQVRLSLLLLCRAMNEGPLCHAMICSPRLRD